MIVQLNKRKLIILSFAFIVFTAIGTISHEYGHIAVAKSFGYSTELHYASMRYHSKLKERLWQLSKIRENAIRNNHEYAEKQEYQEVLMEMREKDLLIRIGGPLQTIITGTLGLVFLSWRKKKIEHDGMQRKDWLALFLGLFWLRELFNLAVSMSYGILSKSGKYFGGDEKNIALALNLWEGTIPILLAAMATLALYYLVFIILPRRERPNLIIAGVIGGLLGYYLWLHILGPVILP